LLDDSVNIKENLQGYINAFSPNARDIFEGSSQNSDHKVRLGMRNPARMRLCAGW
jgi:hypothetical protein